MYCRICGVQEDSVRLRPSKRSVLCDSCSADTPRKASRESFERRYWGSNIGDVPRSTRNDFWSDYLASTLALDAYIEATTEPC
jgi:hypothetical protein